MMRSIECFHNKNSIKGAKTITVSAVSGETKDIQVVAGIVQVYKVEQDVPVTLNLDVTNSQVGFMQSVALEAKSPNIYEIKIDYTNIQAIKAIA
jgi:tRNA-binding EMAP/Myf-like protein